jgi:hypothetical protein
MTYGQNSQASRGARTVHLQSRTGELSPFWWATPGASILPNLSRLSSHELVQQTPGSRERSIVNQKLHESAG